MRVYMMLTLAGVTLAGCDMITPPWKIWHLEAVGDQPVTCEAGKDCDEKWKRAKAWVSKKAKVAFPTQTDTLLKTADSTNLSPEVAFTITKVQTGPTSYRFDYQADCDDWLGCTPPLIKLKASFVEYVMGTADKIQ